MGNVQSFQCTDQPVQKMSETPAAWEESGGICRSREGKLNISVSSGRGCSRMPSTVLPNATLRHQQHKYGRFDVNYPRHQKVQGATFPALATSGRVSEAE
jgi:hypothetical protein